MEIEAKYRLADARLREHWQQIFTGFRTMDGWRLLAGSRRQLAMEAHYLDTAEQSLAGQGASLRLRREGERVLWNIKQTIRRAGAVAVREEWEAPLPLESGTGAFLLNTYMTSLQKAIARCLEADETPSWLRPLLLALQGKALRERAWMQFQRELLQAERWPLTSPEGTGEEEEARKGLASFGQRGAAELLQTSPAVVEWSIDQGFFAGISERREFAEMECELKQGEPSDLEAWLEELSASGTLLPESRSKLARALELH